MRHMSMWLIPILSCRRHGLSAHESSARATLRRHWKLRRTSRTGCCASVVQNQKDGNLAVFTKYLPSVRFCTTICCTTPLESWLKYFYKVRFCTAQYNFVKNLYNFYKSRKHTSATCRHSTKSALADQRLGIFPCNFACMRTWHVATDRESNMHMLQIAILRNRCVTVMSRNMETRW